MFDEKIFQMLVSFVIAPLLGFAIKVVFDRLKSNESAIHELKQEVEGKYQSKELAQEVNRGIKDKLDLILDTVKEVKQKLDTKADK